MYLIDIIKIIDGVESVEKCVLGKTECSIEDPCPLHEDWDPIRNQILHLVREKSLHEVAQQIRINEDGHVREMSSFLSVI